MAQQQQQKDDFRMDSSSDMSNNNNVDEITHRLDQMNVDTNVSLNQQQQSGVNIVDFPQQFGRHPENTGGQERMSIENENVRPGNTNDNHHRRQPQTSPAQRAESNILIVTNVDPLVFSDPLVKAKFEMLFTPYDERVLFRYLKSFRRVRLDFSSARAADSARLNLNNYQLGSTAFKCYLAQMIRPNIGNSNNSTSLDVGGNNMLDHEQNASIFTSDQQQESNLYLSIPRQSKQFLISPPVSPPAGWKPHDESSPCIDVQLISAIANLVPGQVHEIHPGNESQPGIFVEVCEEKQQQQYDSLSGNNRTRIPKTANPIAAARAAIGQAMRSS